MIKTSDKWISVDFALPDTTRWVWIYMEGYMKKLGGVTGIGYYDDEYWCFTDDTKVAIGAVTHWQTLITPKKPRP